MGVEWLQNGVDSDGSRSWNQEPLGCRSGDVWIDVGCMPVQSGFLGRLKVA